MVRHVRRRAGRRQHVSGLRARVRGHTQRTSSWRKRRVRSQRSGSRCRLLRRLPLVEGVRGLVVPVGDDGRFGRDPTVPWRSLAAVAIGTTDASGVISQLSADIANVLGGASSEWLAESLKGLMHPDDELRLPDLTAPREAVRDLHDVRLRHLDGSWVNACVLVAPDAGDRDGRARATGSSATPVSGSNFVSDDRRVQSPVMRRSATQCTLTATRATARVAGPTSGGSKLS